MPIKLNGATFNNGGTAKFNGTTLSKIVFNTTTVWEAETVLYNGSTLLSGYTLVKGDNTSTTYNGLWYAKPRYNEAGGYKENGYAYVAFNASNFNTVKITYSVNCGTYSIVQVGIKSATGVFDSLTYTRFDRTSAETAGGTASGTATLNISSATGTKYIGCWVRNTQGNTTDAVITKVVLI